MSSLAARAAKTAEEAAAAAKAAKAKTAERLGRAADNVGTLKDLSYINATLDYHASLLKQLAKKNGLTYVSIDKKKYDTDRNQAKKEQTDAVKAAEAEAEAEAAEEERKKKEEEERKKKKSGIRSLIGGKKTKKNKKHKKHKKTKRRRR